MKLSICFLGAGHINAKHIRILKKLFPNMRIGIASRDPNRAQNFKNKFNLDAVFYDYESAIASDFPAIALGLPPKCNFDLAQKGMDAGKHLFIEKPIFNSHDEFRRLWPRLQSYKGVVAVGENQWFDPLQQKIKKCLQENDFGRPLFFDFVRLGRPKTKPWFSDPTHMPLGALHEGGVHWIRRLLDCTSVYEKKPMEGILGVRAYKPPISLLKNIPEDTMMVTARHASGAISRLYYSWGIPKRAGGFLDFSKIHLENGAIYFNSAALIGFVFGAKKKILITDWNDYGGYKKMWRHTITCMEEGKKPDLSLGDIYLDFAYMDAAYRSAASGKEETLQI